MSQIDFETLNQSFSIIHHCSHQKKNTYNLSHIIVLKKTMVERIISTENPYLPVVAGSVHHDDYLKINVESWE